MCKLIRFFLLSLAVVSCQKSLFSLPPRSQPNGSGQSASRDTTAQPAGPDAGTPVPDLYATAFCFPDSVDWRAGEPEAADVVLFKNGNELLRVTVPGRPDPERHRIWGGKLWTDVCDGREVIVSRDGTERFRYEGDELLRGFLLVGNAVYTLGQRQGREGLCFRIKGEERFSSPVGTVLGGPLDSEWEGGAFSRDASGICYTYAIPVRKGDRQLWEYRVMREDEVLKILPAGSVDALFDIRVSNGVIYRSELRSSIRDSYCLVKDETYYTVEMSSTEEPHYCKLVPADGEILLKGYSTGISSSKKYTFWYRDSQNIRYIAIDNQPITDLLADDGHSAYLVESPDGKVRTLYLDKENIPFSSDRYSLPSSRCALLKKGVLGIALSNPESGEHLLIRDREVSKLEFNGYFTSVYID